MSFIYEGVMPPKQRSWLEKFRESYDSRTMIKELTVPLMHKVFSKQGLDDSFRFVGSYREIGIAYYLFEVVWPDGADDKRIAQTGLKVLMSLKNTFEEDYMQPIDAVLYADGNSLRIGIADTPRGYDNMVALIQQAEEIKRKHETEKLAEKRRKQQAMREFKDRGGRLH